MSPFADPAFIDPRFDCRAVSFENPTGGRGSGGASANGRKGAASRPVAAGESVTLAELEGPGTIRHVWMTLDLAPPDVLRALVLEVRYDGRSDPSVAVPVLDFFGCPHGRPRAYHSALTAVQEGRGFNSYLPIPFGTSVHISFVNGSNQPVKLFYQLDLTLEPTPAVDRGHLHVSFRRENPTTLGRDFAITSGLRGPGRFLGTVVGIRVLDEGTWYGEGEVKIFRDGDDELPTICGTGLEDYVGTAWGLGEHAAPYGGAPLVVAPPEAARPGLPPGMVRPDFVGFYRWHLLDPVMFEHELRVTIQQIGSAVFLEGQDDDFADFAARRQSAGHGWMENLGPHLRAIGLYERVDDYCATAFVYCREPQSVPLVDIAVATADVGRRGYEVPDVMERPRVAPDTQDLAAL